MTTHMQEFNPIIHRARVARLATADSKAKPHIVPVVFAFDGEKYYIPIDEKTKTTKPGELRRIKNIEVNPTVALLIDEYNEDWNKLFFIMVQGKAAILGKKKGNDEGKGEEEQEDGDDKLMKKLIIIYKVPSVSTHRYWKTKYSDISSKDNILEYVLQAE